MIPFAGWTESGAIAAIDALTREVNEDLPRRAVDHEIRIVFASGDGEVSEEQFFSEVEARFPGAAPAIRRLVDRYSEVAERNDYLFSRGEEGIGILASAVKTLGVLDASALPDSAALRRLRGPGARVLLRRHDRACRHQGARVDRRCRGLRVLGVGVELLQHARPLREGVGRVGIARCSREPRAARLRPAHRRTSR